MIFINFVTIQLMKKMPPAALPGAKLLPILCAGFDKQAFIIGLK